MLATLLAAFALAFFPQPSVATPVPAPASAQAEAELRDKVQRWIADLASDQPGFSEEATIQLAHVGAPALDALEARCPSPKDTRNEKASNPTKPAVTPVDPTHLKAVLELMLLKTISPQDVSSRPGLAELCHEDLDAAEQIAAKFEDSRVVADAREGGLGPNGAIQLPETSGELLWMKQLREMGGFAAPAVIKLCHSKNPAARIYGIRLVARLTMSSQVPLIRSLSNDMATATVSHGDSFGPEQVKHVLEESMNSRLRFEPPEGMRLPGFRACYEPESYVDHLLPETVWGYAAVTNRLRVEAKSSDATTWDDYWARARPLFREILQKGLPAGKPSR